MLNAKPEIRMAPKGFTAESWARFQEDGILVVPDALTPAEVRGLLSLIDGYHDAIARSTSYDVTRIVEMHPLFARLINHDSHIGYMHDLYGDGFKILLSQFFVRPPRVNARNNWHFDGPRVLPFQAFGSRLPMRVKVGYWLTPLSKPGMGNLIFIKGSHRWADIPQYHSHEPHPAEEKLIVQPGAMVLMWAGLWHRVDLNESDITRKNIFLEYGPAWINSSDRWTSDLAWVETLSREQRVIVRPYDYPNEMIKLREEDVPLFLPRSDDSGVGLEQCESSSSKIIPIHLQRHRTWVERNL